MKHLKFIIASVMLLAAGAAALACSRVVYLGDNGIVLAGRTLDWRTPIPTNVYVYPKGIAKESMPSGPRLEWVSKYGSVLAVGLAQKQRVWHFRKNFRRRYCVAASLGCD